MKKETDERPEPGLDRMFYDCWKITWDISFTILDSTLTEKENQELQDQVESLESKLERIWK